MYNLLADSVDFDAENFSQREAYQQRKGTFFMRFFSSFFLKTRRLFFRKKRLLGYFFIFLSLFLFVGYFFVFVPAVRTYQQAFVFADNIRVLFRYVQDQNLDALEQSIPHTRTGLHNLEKEAAALVWIKYVPFVGVYYRDFEHGIRAAHAGLDALAKVVDIVSPYADLLGWSGQGGITGSTQDRIARFVDTMDELLPEIDLIKPQLALIKEEINTINTERYAFSTRIQDQLSFVIEQVNIVEDFVHESKPLLEVLPSFLGRDKPTRYLVLFQNDKELRASGGFLTAYALLTVDKGRVINSESSDIYTIDEKLPIKITPPDQILRYLPEPNGKTKTHLQTRDSNYLPDFKESAQQIEWFYSYVKPIDFDGIIAVDTHVVERIVALLGPVTVDGITFSSAVDSRCNCPHVVYELENYAQRSMTGNAERKALIGDLMQEILLQVFKHESKIPLFAAEAISLLNKRHVQIYMHDRKMQAAVEHLDWAGRIATSFHPTKFRYQDGLWDYWYWNESNYAGQKANLYIKHVSDHVYKVSADGTITKSVTVTVENPQRNDWWLNGKYRAYFRAYVPYGSRLLEGKGSRDPIQTFSQYGKTVFDGFYEVIPLGEPRKIMLTYVLPFKLSDSKVVPYLIQKQPGTAGFTYTISGILAKQSFTLDADKKLDLVFP